MVIMGGGPDVPSKDASKKELVLCSLPWPQDKAQKGMDGLKEEFKDVDVEYFYTAFDNGKLAAVDIPEGTSLEMRLDVPVV
jgi:hypothetical protein